MRAGEHHLERDHPLEPQLPRLVDDAHAAPAELAEEFIVGNRDLGADRGRVLRECLAIRGRGTVATYRRRD